MVFLGNLFLGAYSWALGIVFRSVQLHVFRSVQLGMFLGAYQLGIV